MRTGMRAIAAVWIVCAGIPAIEANAQSIPKDIAARVEIYAIPSLTISDQQFLTGDANGTAVTVAGQMLLGLALAVLIDRVFFGKRLFRAIYYVPVVTSWVAVSVIWQWIFNPAYGLVNYVLSWFGIDGPAWLIDPDTELYAIIITSVWNDLGFVAVMFLGGLQGIP